MVFKPHLYQCYSPSRSGGDMESEWVVFHVAIADSDAQSCSHKVADASFGRNPQMAKDESYKVC